MEHIRGSEWRKWDLHVHTPCSLVHHYGGNDDEVWERYLSDLEALPPEFAVLGINDYIFIDGYRRVLEARSSGRLQNIALILPVIELRLDKFGGSANTLSRVNFHVIFSDKIGPDVIEHQFLNALSSKYRLTPHCDDRGITWGGVPTRDSLVDLGDKIIASAPEAERHKYNSPLNEGFNNLNLSLRDIQGLLEGDYFKGRVLTAVGKTEWDAVKWNDQSVADKKTIINAADFVFISAESPSAHENARTRLTKAEVNDRLLDCSDAHRFSDSADKDRIGKCFSWLKADTTFEGLHQTIHESKDRIFVGDLPPQISSVRLNPTKFIRSLKIAKTISSATDEIWFDGVRIPFNSGLVAVIGNKGNGKSALVDILGLLGNSRQQSHASFLNKERFNHPKQRKGEQFEGTLEWHSGHTEVRLLSHSVDPTAVERVKYVPQNFFEKVCNELTSGEAVAFDTEIQDVIFSHVPFESRLGKETLRDLIAYKTSEIERSLTSSRAELSNLNRRILDVKNRASQESYDILVKQKATRQAEIDAVLAGKPEAVSEPGEAAEESAQQGAKDIAAARARLAETEKLIEEAKLDGQRLAGLLATTGLTVQKLDRLRKQTTELIDEVAVDLGKLGVPLESVVSFTLNEEPIKVKQAELLLEKERVDSLLDESVESSLMGRRDATLKQIAELQTRLDEPGKHYQSHLQEMRQWEEACVAIIGTKDIPGSLTYIENQIDKWSDLPIEVKELEDERLLLSRSIHAKLVELKAVYEELYRPVQDFIANHSIAKDHFRLNFDVAITEMGFAGHFFAFINQSVNGSFCGKEAGEDRLRAILDGCDFDSEEGTLAFLNEIEKCLTHDHRKEPPVSVQVASQMKKGGTADTLFDYLFGLEYLKPKYVLQMGGKNLHQLSPGEKGSLLLVFYLLVDQNDTPLIIDQPEENLDNQTVVSLLVPSVKMAKSRRQIFIVTHNPNIAVVCDAEQIIYASHIPENKNRLTYLSGSIENPEINGKIMDVLEGTKPAFDNRSVKYL